MQDEAPGPSQLRALIDNEPKQIMACTRCIRGGKVVKAVRGRKAPVPAV